VGGGNGDTVEVLSKPVRDRKSEFNVIDEHLRPNARLFQRARFARLRRMKKVDVKDDIVVSHFEKTEELKVMLRRRQKSSGQQRCYH